MRRHLLLAVRGGLLLAAVFFLVVGVPGVPGHELSAAEAQLVLGGEVKDGTCRPTNCTYWMTYTLQSCTSHAVSYLTPCTTRLCSMRCENDDAENPVTWRCDGDTEDGCDLGPGELDCGAKDAGGCPGVLQANPPGYWCQRSGLCYSGTGPGNGSSCGTGVPGWCINQGP